MAGHGERSDGGAESRHDLQESIFGEAQPANAGLAGFHGFFPLSGASPPSSPPTTRLGLPACGSDNRRGRSRCRAGDETRDYLAESFLCIVFERTWDFLRVAGSAWRRCQDSESCRRRWSADR